MPVLDNAKHELFAQGVAVGKSGRDAYKAAGFKTKTEQATDAAASRLLSDVRVKARIAEIQSEGATAAGVTVEAIVKELARLGFSDIRKVVSWRAEAVPVQAEEGEVGQAILSRVTVLDSATIDDDAAAAVSEVSQGANGALRVKLHDKLPALVRLGEHLGMFKGEGDGERQVNLSVFVDAPPRETYEEWQARRNRELAARGVGAATRATD